MPPDARKWLEDIVSHGQDALSFVEGKTVEDYSSDKLLRAGVERKLFIVGEAVVQLKNNCPETALAFDQLTQIIRFRNILAHGYFEVDDVRVWSIVTEHLPKLVQAAIALLA